MIHIEKEIIKIKEEVILTRRELHKIPEIAFEEEKTSGFIVEKLEEYGVKVYKNIAKTGVIGYLKGSVGEKTIAFRADMDALNIEEATKLSYRSKHKGMMHACGHDAHMGVVLGLAKYLSMNKEKLIDNIVFLFQPAEEGPGGARPMIEEGVLEKFHIDKIIGLHVYPEVKEGRVGCKKGPMMAQTGEFDIVIYGESGHGAIPQKAKDSIVIAANLITSYQTIVSRSINPVKGAVLTIGKMWSGERRNIIAANAHLEGTLRAFHEDVYKKMKERMIDLAKGIEKMYDCRIDIIFRDMYPAINNDADLVDTLIKAVGRENIDLVEPQMIAEDFSYFQKEIPGLFFFLGVRNEKEEAIYPLHNCCFNFHEDVLLMGIQVYVNILRTMNGFE
ncbi:M20 metallopeptidase family protein [Crassaminicella profunda]|uniref:M20 metallopeptidase family protein n=1 Tax=Crassaminicella profunda TaxID=1286698 RepID=UPI001CA69904|nr:amidohydrolase [Crassaminicella profunda]QZY56273.1 amidohydrolase [Crassaminicella profunda]